MIISDLHLHSPYSRATSRDITIRNLEKYARMKGLNLLGSGDFTHPEWLKILKANLTEDGSGILKSDSGFNFLLSTEVSNIYTFKGKVRRIHNVILAPDFDTVEQINSWLSGKGRLDYDGRPIFGFGCPELVEKITEISDKAMVIPAHIWTPWFSLFGSKSGFDSLEECYKDQAKRIYALETGLSSDPRMNWRLSSLDKYSLVSFSDSHSHWPWRLGREATVFDLKSLSYDGIINSLKTKEGLVETIEFFPEEGKYHYDGHRGCGVSLRPSDSEKAGNICPVCGKPLTIGVLHRVEELADRPEGYKPENAKPFRSFVPLSEVIAFVKKSQPYSKSVWEDYMKLINAFGSELNVLMDAKEEDISKNSNARIAGLITKMRSGKVTFAPGHDGEYGRMIEEPGMKGLKTSPQKTLSDF